MNRRELLQAAAVFVVADKVAAEAFELKPATKYELFFDPTIMGEDFGERFMAEHPGSKVYKVILKDGSTMDDAIRLYTTLIENRPASFDERHLQYGKIK